jgi:phosphoglycerate dehydrogenase-like enzyme
MTRIAVLDDYQSVATTMADWSTLPADAVMTVFNDHVKELDALADRLAGHQVVCLMRERTPFPRDLFQRLPDLRLLITTGMRNASVDMAAAKEHGVTVCGTRSFGQGTAELTWGLILNLARHIPHEHNAMRAGGWQTTIGRDLTGSTLGLLGLGKLGSRVAAIGKAFGMEVIAWSRNLTDERAAEHGARRVDKDDLFRLSDVLSIHVVLSDATRGLVGRRELELMKPSAFLVNTSRGPIVDEAALLQLLEAGRIAGAGLDVYSTEPLPPDAPIRRAPNVVLTPHLGYVTARNYEAFYGDIVEDIRAWLSGSPVRVITE